MRLPGASRLVTPAEMSAADPDDLPTDPFARELALFGRRSADPRRAVERRIRTPEEWLDDRHLSGDAADFDPGTGIGCWPNTRTMFIKAASGDWEQIGYTGAFGTGKTATFVTLLFPYWIYQLSCHVSPQALMGLQPHSMLMASLVHQSQTKAVEKLLNPMKDAMSRMPYFDVDFPWDRSADAKQLKFPKNIRIQASITDPEAVRSHDLWAFLVDEANFLPVVGKSAKDKEGRGYDAAQTIWEAGRRRQTSRFEGISLWTPKCVLLSSRDRPHDFLERREREALETGTAVGPPDRQDIEDPKSRRLFFSRALWEARPRGTYSMSVFRVEVGGDGRRSRMLAPGEEPTPGARVVDVPDDFREQFDKNVDEALRELAGVAVAGVGLLFPDPDVVDGCFVLPSRHPFTRLTTTLQDGAGFLIDELFDRGRPKCCPGRWRFAHVDVGLTQDAFGIGVVHAHGSVTVVRRHKDDRGRQVRVRVPIIHVDWAQEVVPPVGGGEIRLSPSRDLLLELRDMGMKIAKTTFDSYQDAALRQDLAHAGVPSGRRSVDKTPQAYLDLRDAAEEDRLRCYEHPTLRDQLKRLIWYKAQGKVDHPPQGRKDVADCVAGAAANMLEAGALAWSDADGVEVGASVIGGDALPGSARRGSLRVT